ncbi:hypothetical protein EIP86_008080 [Pleurotus ostreatoroseus]|nr:hypothetical protein EIP86_008080 [Pleurotus ostreatoroseus]
MLAPAATPSLSPPLATPQHSAQHQYGTRIRSNSVIKPSARLRQSTDSPAPPRRLRPFPVAKAKSAAPPNASPPPDLPDFPPPNVMLHSEDADNKVLLAIGRSFVSVVRRVFVPTSDGRLTPRILFQDNKAMTIKDLAEMTMKYGLMCQNVSAAGQAITTYIRNHLQRCEAQQDHPLLLRHVLSGTPSDDDLVDALHSRSGGAHCMLDPSDKRVTNFRRGTMVWYLSRAAGAPCPFARAGIRLCDYNENGKKGIEVNPGKERKRERDRQRRAEQCGQKRKRLLRACADRQDSDSDSSSDEQPQCKKPLTLRLPALTTRVETPRSPSPDIIDLSRSDDEDESSSDESMSVDSSSSSDEEDEDSDEELQPKLEPTDNALHATYACQSGSMPTHAPAMDDPSDDQPAYSPSPERSWRSPSAFSAASPPPDSDDEDFYMNFGSEPSGTGPDSADDAFTDFEFGADTDTQWDSPGPMSPPAQFIDEEVVVKQEPRDVQGLLDSWEGFDSSIARIKVMDIVAQAAAAGQEHEVPKRKPEEFAFDELWKEMTSPGFEEFLPSPEDERPTYIKQEEEEDALSFTDRLSMSPSMSPLSPFTPFSALSTTYFRDLPGEPYIDVRRGSEHMWADAELFSPESVKPHDFDSGVWQEHDAAKGEGRSAEAPVPIGEPAPASTGSDASAAASPGESRSCGPDRPMERAGAEGPTPSSPSALPIPPCCAEAACSSVAAPPAVSHHVAAASEQSTSSEKEEVVVVDTLTPCVPAIWATTFEGISVYQMVLGASHIFRRIDTDFVNVTPIAQFLGLPPPDADALPAAVVVSRGDALVCGTWVDLAAARALVRDEPLVRTFLSDALHELFPQPLQDFHRSSAQGRALRQFGPPFQSMATEGPGVAGVGAEGKRVHAFRVELPPRRRWAVEDHLLSVHPPFALRAAAMVAARPEGEEVCVPETPLSPTEEAMFQTLCGGQDWDAAPAPEEEEEEEESPVVEAANPEPVVADPPTEPLSQPEPVPESTSEPEPPVAEADVDVVEAAPKPSVKGRGKERERESARERPLRRSKRVASAAVLRSRTRSAKRGSRTLS